MLAIENAEIGGTLIALSVPGLKPLFGVRFGSLHASFSKSQSRSGPVTYPTRRTRGRSQLGSGTDVIIPSETTIRTHGPRPNDSDDSLLGGDGIHVRKELNVETKNADIRLESYPKNW